jgi:indolepyruvate ferredoxin oxidoreductase
MGKPYELAFHVLRRMRRLRETPFDIFGWDPDRRTERAVIAEYERLICDAVRPSSPQAPRQGMPYEALVRIAGSAMSIKGYGPVKEAAVAEWRTRIAELRRQGSAVAEPKT